MKWIRKWCIGNQICFNFHRVLKENGSLKNWRNGLFALPGNSSNKLIAIKSAMLMPALLLRRLPEGAKSKSILYISNAEKNLGRYGCSK